MKIISQTALLAEWNTFEPSQFYFPAHHRHLLQRRPSLPNDPDFLKVHAHAVFIFINRSASFNRFFIAEAMQILMSWNVMESTICKARMVNFCSSSLGILELINEIS